jgi:hypothetical protein
MSGATDDPKGHSDADETPEQLLSDVGDREVRLTVRQLDEDFVMIEGDSTSLAFLGRLLGAIARSSADCGCQLGPSSAGASLFSSDASVGLYLHRIPCEHTKTRDPRE